MNGRLIAGVLAGVAVLATMCAQAAPAVGASREVAIGRPGPTAPVVQVQVIRGGGKQAAPDTDGPADGWIVERLMSLPRSGSGQSAPKRVTAATGWIRLRPDQPTDIHVDGRILSLTVTRAGDSLVISGAMQSGGARGEFPRTTLKNRPGQRTVVNFTGGRIGPAFLAVETTAREDGLIITNKDNGKAFVVTVGQVFSIRLRGEQPKTGWEYGESRTPHPLRIQKRGFAPARGAGDPAVGTYIFTFNAVAAGKQEIVIRYVYPGGPKVGARRATDVRGTFKVTITVVPDDPPQPTSEKKPLVITRADNGKTIPVRVGQTFEIRLKGARAKTAWEYVGRATGPPVRPMKGALVPAEGAADRAGEPVCPVRLVKGALVPAKGAADPAIGTYVFRFRAVAAGRETITIHYVYPSGPGVTTRRRTQVRGRFTVTVDVKPDATRRQPSAGLPEACRAQRVLVEVRYFGRNKDANLDKVKAALKAADVAILRTFLEPAGVGSSAMFLMDCKGRDPAAVLEAVPGRLGGLVFQNGQCRQALPNANPWMPQDKGFVPSQYAVKAWGAMQRAQRDKDLAR